MMASSGRQFTSQRAAQICINLPFIPAGLINPPPPNPCSSPCRSWFPKAITFKVKNPRRTFIHSLKVGLALSLVSTAVLQDDLFNRLGGDNAIWAVMTVVVVFELTAGATLCKGSNRALGTLLAGTLALGVEYLADLAGPHGEAIVVVTSVFVVGAAATFLRFCEPFTSRFDYGVMIFILTFSLIIVSGYRVSDNLGMAVSRFLTILLGWGVCLLIGLLICPVWAGQDLHYTISNNFLSLGGALEDCIKAYFRGNIMAPQDSNDEDDPICKRYNEVLLSKATEESLAKSALWEPAIFSRVGCNGVWKHYVEVAGVLRNCAYTVASLHGCLTSDVLVPFCLRKAFSTHCMDIALQSATLVKELGESIKKRERSKLKEQLMGSLCRKVERLKEDINAYPHHFIHLQKWASVKEPSTPTHKSLAKESPRIHEKILKHSLSLHAPLCMGPSKSISNKDMMAKTFDDSNLKGYPRRLESGSLTEFLSIATITFLLIELVPKLEHLVDVVNDLEEMAHFTKNIVI